MAYYVVATDLSLRGIHASAFPQRRRAEPLLESDFKVEAPGFRSTSAADLASYAAKM